MALNARQRAFVEAYGATGNAAEAARQAGYSAKTARQVGRQLLTNLNVARAIQAQEDERRTAAVANRQERLEFLTEVMRDKARKDDYRLRASDQLNKMDGSYLVRTEVSGPEGRPVEVAATSGLNYDNLSMAELELLEALLAKIEVSDFEPMKRLAARYGITVLTEKEMAERKAAA